MLGKVCSVVHLCSNLIVYKLLDVFVEEINVHNINSNTIIFIEIYKGKNEILGKQAYYIIQLAICKHIQGHAKKS